MGGKTSNLEEGWGSRGNLIGVVKEDEVEAHPSPDDALPGEKDWSREALMGVSDSSPGDTYSMEMVTCPEEYPIWRTRMPIVLVLTHPTKSGAAGSGAFHHYYRYLAVTPGAESETSEDLSSFSGGMSKTKISTGSLTGLGDAINFTGPSFPVTLFENPFLSEHSETKQEQVSREFSNTSFVGGVGGDEKSKFLLENLPYRSLDIDISTASVAKFQGMNGDSLQYTEDGIPIDNWNGCEDVTFQPYCIREGIKARSEVMTSESDKITDLEADKSPKRILIVCYHLPVIVSKSPTSGEWQACWAESILAKTENSSFISSFRAHWVGTVTTNSPVVDESDRQALRSLLATMNCTVLFFDESVRDAHYKGFCKQVLWLAFHHVDLLDMRDKAFSMDLDAMPTKRQATGTLTDLRLSWDQRQVSKWWEAFNFVNSQFAVEVAKMVHPDDIVWVHDYHLSLLPRMLEDEEKKIRSSSATARLTKKIFFLHIPFPASMVFREMEWGQDILEGILHADVVGFHSFDYARHFLSSSKRILGVSADSMDGGLIEVKYGKKKVAVTMSR